MVKRTTLLILMLMALVGSVDAQSKNKNKNGRTTRKLLPPRRMTRRIPNLALLRPRTCSNWECTAELSSFRVM